MESESTSGVLEKQLVEDYGRVWNTNQLQEDFTVVSFGFGLCFVERKSDGQKGTLDFSHWPRFYYNFVAHEH